MGRLEVREQGNEEFFESLENTYPEHFRKMTEERISAKVVRFSYPILGFLVSFALMGSLSIFVTVLSHADLRWGGKEVPALERLRPFFEASVPIMWGLTGVIVFFTVVLCAFAGASQARSLRLSAEKTEMASRVEYYLKSLFMEKKIPSSRQNTESSAEKRNMSAKLSELPELDIRPQ